MAGTSFRAVGKSGTNFVQQHQDLPVSRRVPSCAVISADSKRGQWKGSASQKSKIVKKCQKYFRHFSTFFAQGEKTSKIVKKCQKYFRHFSTIFARHQFAGPFWGALIITCAVRPVFARVVGELRAADPSNVQGPVKQNASPGEQSEAPRPRWKPGQEQNPGPENQESQHMLEQPRGYFPEQGFPARNFGQP